MVDDGLMSVKNVDGTDVIPLQSRVTQDECVALFFGRWSNSPKISETAALILFVQTKLKLSMEFRPALNRVNDSHFTLRVTNSKYYGKRRTH